MPQFYPSARRSQGPALQCLNSVSRLARGLAEAWTNGAVAKLCWIERTHCVIADERMLLAADNQVVETIR